MDETTRRLVDRQGITYLYHITHLRNLPSIAMHGLLSHAQAHTAHSPTDISDPDVQAHRTHPDPIHEKPLHAYVPLYFCARNPMLSRLRNYRGDLAVLCIERGVMQAPGVIFTDGNAASRDTCFCYDLADLDKLDWACIRAQYWTNHPDGKRKRCAEVLVPDVVPFSAVHHIVVYNDAARAVAHAAAAAHMAPSAIAVEPGLFF